MRASCQLAASTLKRGGRCAFISWDDVEREGRVEVQAPAEWTAEKVYEREWALTLIEQVFDRLREECRAADEAKAGESSASTAVEGAPA